MVKKKVESKKTEKTTKEKNEVKKTVVKAKVVEKKKAVKEKKQFNINNIVFVLIFIAIAYLLSWVLKTNSLGYDESYQIAVTEGSPSPVGLFDLFKFPANVFSQYGNLFIFILSIAGLYGVLSQLNAYKQVINKIIDKYSNHKTILLVTIIAFVAILTSICGGSFTAYTPAALVLMIIIPFIISIIIGLGYDKIVAALVTVGSYSVGLIGTTISAINTDSSISGNGIVNALLSTKATDLIAAKIVLLIVGIAILAFNVILYTKKNADKFAEPKKLEVVENQKAWPLIVIFDLTLLVALLSQVSWTSVFGVSVFSDLVSKIASNELATKILGTVPAFECWDYYNISGLLLIETIILFFIFSKDKSITKLVNDFVEGIKKAIKPVFIVATICILYYFVVDINTGSSLIISIAKPIIGLTKGFNAFTTSLAMLISSIFAFDSYNIVYLLYYLTSAITDTAKYSILGLIIQSMFGVASILAPTSIVLMAILSYLKVSYTEWIKKSWLLILELLLAILITLTIVVIIL